MCPEGGLGMWQHLLLPASSAARSRPAVQGTDCWLLPSVSSAEASSRGCLSLPFVRKQVVLGPAPLLCLHLCKPRHLQQEHGKALHRRCIH